MDVEEVEAFESDRGAGKEEIRRYWTGREEENAPKKDFAMA
jgi:hypothetical protein